MKRVLKPQIHLDPQTQKRICSRIQEFAKSFPELYDGDTGPLPSRLAVKSGNAFSGSWLENFMEKEGNAGIKIDQLIGLAEALEVGAGRLLDASPDATERRYPREENDRLKMTVAAHMEAALTKRRRLQNPAVLDAFLEKNRIIKNIFEGMQKGDGDYSLKYLAQFAKGMGMELEDFFRSPHRRIKSHAPAGGSAGRSC